jgi:transcriptional regulator of acetoin/glycerol metabolism
MVARSIHFSGPFRNNPFNPVHSGSLVPTLMESELFGYVKGAFTGAEQQAPRLRSIPRRSGVRNFARNNGAWRVCHHVV